MKQSNQSGFAAVEALLVVVILAIVAGTGYFVWHAKQNTDKSLSHTANSQPAIAKTSKKGTPVNTTNTANIVQLTTDGALKEKFTIPSDWETWTQFQGKPSGNCSMTATNSLHSLSANSAFPKKLSNSEPDSLLLNFDIVKQPDSKTLAQYYYDDLFQGDNGTSHKTKDFTINGDAAYYYEGDDESYQDDVYLVAHKGYVACFSARVKSVNVNSSIDNTSYEPMIESIVKSVTFK